MPFRVDGVADREDEACRGGTPYAGRVEEKDVIATHWGEEEEGEREYQMRHEENNESFDHGEKISRDRSMTCRLRITFRVNVRNKTAS